MQQFFIKPIVYFGDCSLDYLSSINCRKVLLITDPFLEENQMTKKVTDALAKTEIRIFSGVEPDPDIHVIHKAVEVYMQEEPDTIIAYGGGSTIDATKSMLYFANRLKSIDRQALNFIAIPTTSGTGSEVTRYSVITTSEGKLPIVDDKLLPDVAILNAMFTESLPPRIIAETGMDVMTHALEAYVSKNASYCTESLAEKAASLVWRFLLETYRDPHHYNSREAMHEASCIAGMAFTNAGLGLNHAMAHALGATFNISHGLSNALILPEIIAFNSAHSERARDRYAEIAKRMDLDVFGSEDGVRKLIFAMKSLRKELGLAESICQAGIEEEEFHNALDKMVAQALDDTTLITNPVAANASQIREIYLNAY